MGQPAGAAGWELSELDLLGGGGEYSKALCSSERER